MSYMTIKQIVQGQHNVDLGDMLVDDYLLAMQLVFIMQEEDDEDTCTSLQP